MPIYKPTLPPRPTLGQGSHPIAVLMRFDLKRVLRQKLGRFFGFIFLIILLVELAVLYFKYLLKTNEALSAFKAAEAILTQGAAYQAGHLDNWVLLPLWFQVALIGGGLVARDTLHRVRPLIYAHPVRPADYLLAKGGLSALLPLLVQLPFILLPWFISLLIAGKNGPVWPIMPLYMVPAALINAALMGSVALGASAMSSTPRASVGWVLGIVLGTSAVGGMFAGLLNNTAAFAISPYSLVVAWPQLICGVQDTLLGWGPTVAGTLFHLTLWTFVAWKRTRPSEAIL